MVLEIYTFTNTKMKFYKISKKVKSKKSWMTLIEILIVVAIIWIIAWIAIPKVSNSKMESRDIRRISEIQEIWSAIMSYKTDHWWYPVSSGTCISSLTELIDDWYFSTMPPDPNNEKILTYCSNASADDRAKWSICTWWYYNYISNGSWFVLAAYMEDSKNWNYICLNNATTCHDIITDKDRLCQDLAELWSWGNLTAFMSNNRLNDGLKSHIYVYLRE